MSSGHRRGIAATLVLLDEVLCDVTEWASGRSRRSVLIREDNDLSAGQRARLIAIVENARRLLAGAADRLGLEPETRYVSSSVWSACITARLGVAELASRHLNRYGEVPPELVDYMDDLSAALLRELDRMIDTVPGGAEEG